MLRRKGRRIVHKRRGTVVRMKICLINPPRLMKPFSASLKAAPPLGLAFIAAVLREDGHDVRVIDTTAEGFELYYHFADEIVANGLSPEETAARIPADVGMIGITVMFSGNWPHTRMLIDFLGERFPDALIVAGGEHITAAPEFSIRNTKHLAVCVLGEGEDSSVELARAIERGQPLETVQGIVYRKERSLPVSTPRRTRIREISAIPRPAWDLFPLPQYRRNGMMFGVDRGVNSLPILATRGCPYQCTFCSSPQMWGTRYMKRSPQDVVDEIEHFIDKYDVRNFDFYDLTAIIQKSWIIDFAREIIRRKLDITWQLPAGTRCEAIDAEVARHLYASGCRNISYAPEAGSREVLRLIKKKVDLNRLLRSISYSAKQGMNIKINFMIGFPQERHRDLWQSLWFLVKASWYGVHDMSPSIFSPYPGSELFRQLQAEGAVDLENDDYFYGIIFVDTLMRNKFYNGKHVSPPMMRVYLVLYLAVFYGSNYLFRPSRLARTVYNLVTNRIESRAEMALVDLLQKSRVKILPAPARLKAS
jgi:radical SAM superfamily enzyme YgiQ (UPF0313 family)